MRIPFSFAGNLLIVAMLLVIPAKDTVARSTEKSPLPGSTFLGDERVSIHMLELQRGYPDYLPPGGIPPRRTARAVRSLGISVTGFFPYWMGDSWTDLPLELLSHVAWFSLELAPNGEFTALHGWPDGPLVDYLHSGGVEALMTVTLFGSDDLRTLLNNTDNSQTAREGIVEQMRLGDADGVMVDFEMLPHDLYWNFLNFMQDLRSDLNTAAAEDGRTYGLWAATPAVDWNGSYSYYGLSDVCDALFIMAYDYYWSGSSTTGPVSPAEGWGTYNVSWTIDDYLYYNGNRPEKLVLGLPWYGYDWPCVSEEAGCATTGTATARTYSSARNLALEQGWQRESVAQTPWTPYYQYSWRQCWHEDTVSLGAKLDLLDAAGLQGVGMWALGYNGDYTDPWEQLRNRYFQPEVPQVSLVSQGEQMHLFWEPVPGAAEYRVYSSSEPYFDISPELLLLTTAQTEIWVSPEESTGFFRVTAVR